MKILRDHPSRPSNNIESTERIINDYILGKIGRREIKFKYDLICEAARKGSVLAEACLGHFFDDGIGV